jgi:O-antigen/teichoic acid export membrane protein
MVAVCLLGSVLTLFGNMMQGFKMYSLSVWTFALSAPFRLLIMFVLMPFRPLSGYVAGQTAGPVVNILGAGMVFRRYLGRSVRCEPYLREHASAIVRYTLPFVVWTVVTTVSGTVDSLVIRHRLPEFESAGYYIITRFSDIAAYLGTAFGAFVFPMVASKQSTDPGSLKILSHSIIGSAVVGFCYSLVLAFLGDDILEFNGLWRPYSGLAGLMALWSVNTTLWSVGICLVTYEMAQGRFGFLWYAIPLVAIKALFLYAVTGYAYFEGVLPKFVLSVISELNPCRLSFVTVVFIVVQSALTITLLLNVLCFNKDHRKNV